MKRERFKLDVSVFVLLKRKDGKLLFIQRKPEKGFDETWSFPAGALDPEETLLTAAARETREEVGVVVKESDLQLVHTLHCLTNGTEWLGMFFLTEKWEGEPRLVEQDKHTAIAWCTADEAPADTRLYVRQALEKYSQNKSLSTYGWEK